jgi:nitrate reductase NapE component
MIADNTQQTTDDRQQTTAINSTLVVDSPWSVVKILAHLFSYLFHPIFIPLYAVAFLVFIHPSYFSGFSMAAKKQTLLIVFINAVAFPILAVVLLKAVGFIQSIFLKTQKDRIIPYMACGIFFFWAYLVFKNQTNYPLILSSFLLGVFLASSAALLANIYFKISMHATGVGGLLGIFLLIMKSNTMLMTWPLCIAIAITGLVCTARLLISDHSTKEIYIGLIAGLLSQFVAAIVVL